MNKPKVGDKLFGIRKYLDGRVREFNCIVEKVGRLYFYVGSKNEYIYADTKFTIADWKEKVTMGTPEYILYPNKQVYLNEKKRIKLIGDIREIIGQYGTPENITLVQAQQFYDILSNNNGDNVICKV